jgi:hypothetical protein
MLSVEAELLQWRPSSKRGRQPRRSTVVIDQIRLIKDQSCMVTSGPGCQPQRLRPMHCHTAVKSVMSAAASWYTASLSESAELGPKELQRLKLPCCPVALCGLFFTGL